MAKEAINKVKEVEERVGCLIREREIRSKAILEEAELKAEKILSSARTEARDELVVLKEKEEKEMIFFAKRVKNQTKEKIEKLKSKITGRLSQAIRGCKRIILTIWSPRFEVSARSDESFVPVAHSRGATLQCFKDGTP